MILFTNATIFNGKKIISSNSVLVEKNKIIEVGKNIKANKIGLKINVYDKIKLKKLGMNALLGVGQGSIRGSYLVTPTD